MYFIFYSIFAPLKQNKYERKEKETSEQSPKNRHYLILLGLLAYKYQLFDEKLLENIPTIENNEEKPEIRIPTQHGGALEIPTMQSGTGGQILKRKGYTLSYNADYKLHNG